MVLKRPSCTTTSPLITLRSTKPMEGVQSTSAATGSPRAPEKPMLPSVFQPTRSAPKPAAWGIFSGYSVSLPVAGELGADVSALGSR